MTKYDKLIDVIKQHLYTYYIDGEQQNGWDELKANESAHKILQTVEEYQSPPVSKIWRASD